MLPDAQAAISDVEDIPEAELETGEPDGETAGEDVRTDGVVGAVADNQPDDEFDPCTLVTAQEWAAWLDGTEPDGNPVHLEYGEACGYLAEGDDVRLAVALIDLGNGSWLDEVDAETVDVAGEDGLFAAGYPIAPSSTLVVTTPKGELVIEMSGGDRDRQREGAVHFAALALGRVPS